MIFCWKINEVANDVLIINTENSPFQWAKSEKKGELPISAIYHNAGVCAYSGANGMLTAFGEGKKTGKI